MPESPSNMLPALIDEERAKIDCETSPFSTPLSTRPNSPASTSTDSSEEENLDSIFDNDDYISSASSSNSSCPSPPGTSTETRELYTSSDDESETASDEDTTQEVHIPSTSRFFRAPPRPPFRSNFPSSVRDHARQRVLGYHNHHDVSHVCDLQHRSAACSCGAIPLSTGNVVVVEAESIVDDGFPRSIHLVREIVEKDIPDFPEDSRVSGVW